MPDGARFEIQGGMNTRLATDAIPPGKYAYLQNVRRYLQGRIIGRAVQSGIMSYQGSLLEYPGRIHTIRALNDSTPDGPPAGYSLIVGTDGNAYFNTTLIEQGLSGNPLSMVPFRPAASPESWMYVGDANQMFKVNYPNSFYKVGIAEPVDAPHITSTPGTTGPNWVTYRYVYRSSETGAVSNPSPESPAQIMTQNSPSSTRNGQAANISYNVRQWDAPGGYTYLETIANAGILMDFVIATNWGFSIPQNARIDGVIASINWAGQAPNTGVLTGVALFYKEAQWGTAKAPGIENDQYSGTAGTETSQGANNDTWGATLTPAVVNDSSFGFGVQIRTQVSGSTARTFLYTLTLQIFYTPINNGVTATPSSDPQVDKIDFYRSDPGLNNWTYVGTVPNDPNVNPSQLLNDTLDDLVVASNPILQFDNYEPFPSIDLPRKGTMNVNNGLCIWASGDGWNPRWLPGTVILIGGVDADDAATAYTLVRRPWGNMMIAANIIYDPVTGMPSYQYPPNGNGLTWEIAEPTLAAQPMPAMWGPTDSGFYFACGDPLRPGVLYWNKGNNFDSAPDTNQQDVTSPSEPLMNGTMISGMGMVFSTERAWLIYPTFTSAYATTQGVLGSQWSMTLAGLTRGLYMRYAICTDGGGRVFFRAKDGIAMSVGGGPEQVITEDIANLFPHEGAQLAPVNINGYVVYPPDDTKPFAQILAYANGYLYYDYQDVWGIPRTLVYDNEAQGWIVDVYGDPVNVHYWNEATGQNDVLVGAWIADQAESYITPLKEQPGTEVATSVVLTPSLNGGDPRVQKLLGNLFLRAMIPVGETVTVSPWKDRYSVAMTGIFNVFSGQGPVDANYLMDLTAVTPEPIDDLGLELTWSTNTGTILDFWQVDWSQIPEQTSGWQTDLTSYGAEGAGLHGWLHIGWINLAYRSNGPVKVTALTDQGQIMTLTFPSTNGLMRKVYRIVPANKFKLIGWTVSGQTNFLDNGNFDSGAQGWTLESAPDGNGAWTVGPAGTSSGGVGTMAVWSGTGTAAVVNQQAINCSPGTVISASCWVVGEIGATGENHLRINFYDSGGNAVGGSIGVGPGASANYAWTHVSFSVAAPPNTSYAQVDYAVSNSQGGGRWFVGDFVAGYNQGGSSAGFALNTADSEMAIKGWGETGPYHILPPFAGSSPQKGVQT